MSSDEPTQFNADLTSAAAPSATPLVPAVIVPANAAAKSSAPQPESTRAPNPFLRNRSTQVSSKTPVTQVSTSVAPASALQRLPENTIPLAQTPVAKVPATIVPKNAAAKTPATEASVASTPVPPRKSADTIQLTNPVVATPVAQAPSAQAPDNVAANPPATEAPVAQTPVAKTPAVQAPNATAKAPTPTTQVPPVEAPSQQQVPTPPATAASVANASTNAGQGAASPTATRRTFSDLKRTLESIVANSISRRAMFESSLNAIAKHFDAFWGLLELQAGGRTVTREFKSREMNTSELVDYAYTLSVDAQMDARSKGRAIPSPEGDYAAISSPIMDAHSDIVQGTMTFFTRLESPIKAKKMVGEVEKALAYISAKKPTSPSDSKAAAQAKAKSGEIQAFLGAAKYDDVRGLCYALVNSYCQKLGCQRTAIGLVEANEVKLYAISGLETIVENSPAVINIRQAQEECLDQDRRIIVQQPTSESAAKSDGLLIHQRWHQQASAAAVASFPIQVEDEIVAVFSFERNLTEPFTEEEASKIEETIQSFGPAIKVMKRSSRSLRSHMSERLYDGLIKPFQSKIVGLAALLALAFFILGWLPYRPTVPCTIEPAKVNHLIAPYDAVIETADLFAGDKIVAGQPIIKFDTRALELERDSILATMRSKEVERNIALAEREKSTAMIINAEVDALAVQLESVERKIAQGVMCAQYDGEIISGDLRHQIGQVVPQGTSLIQVAPKEGMRIELQIPESKATLIEPGYEGYFSSGARPSDRHKFKITKITPATTIVDGQNVVLAEAEVSGDSDWLRTGMTGYANVRAGWQPVWWLTTHKIIDRLRLGFWL